MRRVHAIGNTKILAVLELMMYNPTVLALGHVLKSPRIRTRTW